MFKSVSVLHTNTPSPDVFWRKWWPKQQDYLKLCQKFLTPPKKGQIEVKPDHNIKLNCEGMFTYASCVHLCKLWNNQ